MKRNKLLVYTFLSLSLIFISTSVSALTTTSGSFNILNLPNNAVIGNYGYGTTYTDPDTGEQITVQTLFGHIGAYNTDTHEYRYYIAGALDSNDEYNGIQSYEQSTITGHHNQVNGSKEYTTSAQTIATNEEVKVGIGFNSYLEFNGLLSDFGYNYSFTGNKDSEDDFMTFIVQMEIAYYDESIENSLERWITVYSDYVVSSDEFDARNNWVLIQDADNGTYSGTRMFDYSNFGEQRWSVRWDFGGVGNDTADYIEPIEPNIGAVPEPTSIILFGLGLIGFARISRKNII